MKHSIGEVTNPNLLYYTNIVPDLVEFIESKYDIKITSDKYETLKEDYTDYDGIDDDMSDDIESFKGFNSSTGGSGSVPEQIREASMVYSETCQGRNPLETIIGAVFGYAFQCGAKVQELKYREPILKQLEQTLDFQAQVPDYSKFK